MGNTTDPPMILCEKHAAVLGQQLAKAVQAGETLFPSEVLAYLDDIRRGDVGLCSADRCFTPKVVVA